MVLNKLIFMKSKYIYKYHTLQILSFINRAKQSIQFKYFICMLSTNTLFESFPETSQYCFKLHWVKDEHFSILSNFCFISYTSIIRLSRIIMTIRISCLMQLLSSVYGAYARCIGCTHPSALPGSTALHRQLEQE